jgi:hypothetical protein
MGGTSKIFMVFIVYPVLYQDSALKYSLMVYHILIHHSESYHFSFDTVTCAADVASLDKSRTSFSLVRSSIFLNVYVELF